MTEKLNDATVYGDISLDLMSREIVVSLGSNKESKSWQPMPGTVAQLVAYLSSFQRGPKNGECITPGELIAPQRTAQNVRKNYILMLDHDTGETMDEVQAKIEAAGLFAVLWNTHSHLTTETEIGETAFLNWCKKHGHTPGASETILIEQVTAYLREEKLYQERVLSTITGVTRDFREGGVKFIVKHDHMHKLRSLFVLNSTFDFAGNVSQKAAIDDWKDLVRGVAKMLGVVADASAVDPSRLMFTPRIAPQADKSLYEIRIIDGDPLDSTKAPRVSAADFNKDPRLTAFTSLPAEAGIATSGYVAKTKNMKQAARRLFKFLQLTQMLEAHGYERRGSNGEKFTYPCPNDGAHSNPGDIDDKGFFVVDADGDRGCTMYCSHATCQTQFAGPDGKFDRVRMLDIFCQQQGIEDAMDLSLYCLPGWYDDTSYLDEASAEEAVTALDEAIALLMPDSPSDEVTRLILSAKTLPPIDQARVKEKMRVKLGQTKGSFDVVWRDTRAQDEEGNDVFLDPHPVPQNPETASAIWDHWSHEEKVDVTLARLLYLNRKEPKLFLRPNGEPCIIIHPPGGVSTMTLKDRGQTWSNLLTNYGIGFKRRDDNGVETSVPPFANVVTHLSGEAMLPFPTLERITKVPFFAEDGSIETKNGYHAKARIWLDKGDTKFRKVPETPTESEVDTAVYWISEVLRDFPFTDRFSGGDPLPIRDEAGEPNWERGESSRAHAVAMLLEQFVRNMIDGPTPCYHIGKPMRGSGATLLIQALTMIATGAAQTGQTYAHQNEELKKVITASLRTQLQFMIFDNIMSKVSSPDLPAAITQGVWTDRILGQSDTTSIPIRCTWVMAGNNVKFNEDMIRRNVPIFIDPACPNPEDRAEHHYFKHEPLISALVKPQMDILVWSCHVLVRNWIAKGKPMGKRLLGSFEEWSRGMGGILDAAGIPGFLASIQAYRAEENEDGDGKRNVTQRLWDKYQDQWFTSAEALDALCDQDVKKNGFQFQQHNNASDRVSIDPALGDFEFRPKSNEPSAVMLALGRHLSAHFKGRSFALNDGRHVAREKDKVRGVMKYRLTTTKPPTENISNLETGK